MGSAGLPARAGHIDARRIGMPRALLHYRYGALWTTFFEALGRETVLSAPTDKGTVARGDALSNDECCLASKIYLGHVAALAGACDAVFVPSIANVGLRKGFCTKFQALPDLVANTFADERLPVLSCLVNESAEKLGMKEGLLAAAASLGAGPRDAKRAWKEAAHAQEQAERFAATRQARVLATLAHERQAAAGRPGDAPLGILLAAHPYVAHDPYLGGALVDLLEGLGAVVLFTDEADRKRALQASFDFSDTLPWIVNRELIGAITLLHEHVDGIVLVSAFPCGPDSMTDDAIVRCVRGKPILNLTIDAQSGTAGLETRVESFVDILRYQKKGGYVHGA
ncbi:acyl-CoA dehydratase activase-related protein [Arabiibacter massiliensis]|uniref:acyl-CoA dehydratase activase-related protein n=1 Tax=Arabiibacter massiliensis TaxID=1870985 RepID=UPI0009BBA570|nr:acyl-CoA dehydratase activase-related protein [Arabiibacter massiliensis]